jgi:hypothetical protein
MLLEIIVGCSLMIQLITVLFALHLISVTGWKKAWMLLSLGVITMGIRRSITFIHLLTGDTGYTPEMGYELVGLVGSAIMLGGMVLIKPIFLFLKSAEQKQRELVMELQEALSNIKTLRGLLPMCAWCKRIRNDKGYWEEVHEYIREHSEADVTHGICPECMKEVTKKESDEE